MGPFARATTRVGISRSSVPRSDGNETRRASNRPMRTPAFALSITLHGGLLALMALLSGDPGGPDPGQGMAAGTGGHAAPAGILWASLSPAPDEPRPALGSDGSSPIETTSPSAAPGRPERDIRSGRAGDAASSSRGAPSSVSAASAPEAVPEASPTAAEDVASAESSAASFANADGADAEAALEPSGAQGPSGLGSSVGSPESGTAPRPAALHARAGTGAGAPGRSTGPSGWPGPGEVDRVARPRWPIRPDYPRRARREGRESRVIVEAWIDELGEVAHASVLESGGAEFDASARRAVRHSIFRPAQRAGRDIASRLALRIHFELRD